MEFRVRRYDPAPKSVAEGRGFPMHSHDQTWLALLAGAKEWAVSPPGRHVSDCLVQTSLARNHVAAASRSSARLCSGACHSPAGGGLTCTARSTSARSAASSCAATRAAGSSPGVKKERRYSLSVHGAAHHLFVKGVL